MFSASQWQSFHLCISEAQEIQPFYTFFFTDCSDICVEVNFGLKASDYNINENNFDSVSSEVFTAIRNTISGNTTGEISKVIGKYKS